jgi:hypothetical protein
LAADAGHRCNCVTKIDSEVLRSGGVLP